MLVSHLGRWSLVPEVLNSVVALSQFDLDDFAVCVWLQRSLAGSVLTQHVTLKRKHYISRPVCQS